MKTSPSARRKSHHTALSIAAACNSQCSPTVVSTDDNGMVHALHLSVNIGMIWRSSGKVMPPPWLPASQSSPKGEKTCPDSRPTRMQNFTPLAFSAAEKSVTVQTKTNKNSKLSIPPYFRMMGKLLEQFFYSITRGTALYLSAAFQVCFERANMAQRFVQFVAERLPPNVLTWLSLHAESLPHIVAGKQLASTTMVMKNYATVGVVGWSSN